jgi:hypothetical protein
MENISFVTTRVSNIKYSMYIDYKDSDIRSVRCHNTNHSVVENTCMTTSFTKREDLSTKGKAGKWAAMYPRGITFGPRKSKIVNISVSKGSKKYLLLEYL